MRANPGRVDLPCAKKRDVKLMAHFLVICIGAFIGSTCFYFLPRLLSNADLSHQLNTVISTLSTMTYPCVMIAFQENVRHMIRTFFCKPRVCMIRSVSTKTKSQTMFTSKPNLIRYLITKF
ncbi:hypothetical protein KIN20_011193 [Parelaphostrongylus tenuis]|uniref:Uncharacterized protein n=1 Tax=Parelaphostrongylus tenuis TaxID=148309 RepID=A0AAD5MAN5_PARTN|nr:hypothetical protein KIN20_011193 [Parelaphostrongylus tenuis]